MGPSTPFCYPQSCLVWCLFRDVSAKSFLSWPLVSVFCFEGQLYGPLSPSSFGPCLVFMSWFFPGPLLGGVHRPDDLFFRRHDDDRQERKVRIVRFYLSFRFCFSCFRRDGGGVPPPRLCEYKLAFPRLNSLLLVALKAWLPPAILFPFSSVLLA